MPEDNKMQPEDLEPKGVDKMPSNKQEYTMSNVALPDQPGLSFGIEETLDVVDFGVAIANGAVKSLKDGKVGISDIPHFISPLIKLPTALTGIDKVPAEIGDIDDVELEKLINHVKANLDVDNEKAMEIVQRSLTLIYDAYNLVKII